MVTMQCLPDDDVPETLPNEDGVVTNERNKAFNRNMQMMSRME
jgi:hypothetical protein